jgi:WD40 repeat protein
VAFSPDGQKIVSGSDDHTICIWDVRTGNQIGDPLRGHTDFIYSVAFSPDGQQIVSGSDDHTICIWDANSVATNSNSQDSNYSPLVPLSSETVANMCKDIRPDGWVYTPEGHPLFWVPHTHSYGIKSCAKMCISSKSEHSIVTLDTSRFCYGDNWAKIVDVKV